MNWSSARKYGGSEQCRPNGLRSAFVFKRRPTKTEKTVRDAQTASLARRDKPITLPTLKFMDEHDD